MYVVDRQACADWLAFLGANRDGIPTSTSGCESEGLPLNADAALQADRSDGEQGKNPSFERKDEPAGRCQPTTGVAAQGRVTERRCGTILDKSRDKRLHVGDRQNTRKSRQPFRQLVVGHLSPRCGRSVGSRSGTQHGHGLKKRPTLPPTTLGTSRSFLETVRMRLFHDKWQEINAETEHVSSLLE